VPSTIKSVRLPDELAERISREADQLGVTFNALVVNALNESLGDGGDKSIDLLKELSSWLRQNYSPKSFPSNITFQTFQHIIREKRLRKQYDGIIHKGSGEKDFKALISLHRRIGRLVKTVLKADVNGRIIGLDPGKYLIKSYSKLVPGKK